MKELMTKFKKIKEIDILPVHVQSNGHAQVCSAHLIQILILHLIFLSSNNIFQLVTKFFLKNQGKKIHISYVSTDKFIKQRKQRFKKKT